MTLVPTAPYEELSQPLCAPRSQLVFSRLQIFYRSGYDLFDDICLFTMSGTSGNNTSRPVFPSDYQRLSCDFHLLPLSFYFPQWLISRVRSEYFLLWTIFFIGNFSDIRVYFECSSYRKLGIYTIRKSAWWTYWFPSLFFFLKGWSCFHLVFSNFLTKTGFSHWCRFHPFCFSIFFHAERNWFLEIRLWKHKVNRTLGDLIA